MTRRRVCRSLRVCKSCPHLNLLQVGGYIQCRKEITMEKKGRFKTSPLPKGCERVMEHWLVVTGLKKLVEVGRTSSMGDDRGNNQGA